MSNEAKKLDQPEEPAPELNVLIIAHKQSQFASAAAFLGRRGVTTAVRGNIKDGVQYITSKKATLVFLSWNLPHANILKTHQLLTKNLKLDCVVFAEIGDGKTAAELNASQLPEVMQSPVSGPGLYMRIQKILKAKEDLKNGVSDVHANGNYQQKSEDDKGNYINLGPNKKKQSSGMINFQSPRYSENDYESENNDPSANDISAFLDQIGDDPSKDSTPISQVPNKHGPATYTQKGIITNTAKIEQESMKPSYGSVVNTAKNTPINTGQIQYEVTKPKEAIIQDFKPRSGNKTAESLLAQKTFEAIENSVRPAHTDYASVDLASKAKIFNIHTPRFRGYLIFVVPMFNELDRGVLTSIKTNLEQLLNAQKEYLLFFEELSIEIEQTSFLKWAQIHADFFVQTVDHKTEIICAYYPYKPSLPKLGEEDKKMAKVQIEDLKIDTKTNVNLYIHLPKNDKFVCYMKPGDTITQTHKDKFEKHKIDNLHIKKDEVAKFKEYFVSNQLNEIIRKKTE